MNQLFKDDGLKSFQTLSKEVTLLKSFLYQDLQHALKAQALLTPLRFARLPFLDSVVAVGDFRNGLIAYKSLL